MIRNQPMSVNRILRRLMTMKSELFQAGDMMNIKRAPVGEGMNPPIAPSEPDDPGAFRAMRVVCYDCFAFKCTDGDEP